MTLHTDTPIGGGGDTLNPVTASEKNWGWFAIFNIWANDVQSLFGYSLVASLFISFGVSGWTAFAALICAGLFVMFLVNLSGAPGEKYGIPYPVLARASLGTQGAKLPAILRAIVAVFWYGVQVYFASTAVALLIRSLTGISGGTEVLGLTGVDWLSFVIVWAFHIVIFWRGMDWVETFLNIAGPFVYLVMIGLVIVLWQKADGQLLEAARTIFVQPDATFLTEFNGFVAIVGTMVAYFAAVMINFSDFSRYAKDKPAMVLGNLAGLPFNMVLFSALALLTTAGAAVVYGEAIINPTEIVERTDSVLLSVIAAITFFAATVGINLVANFIPAVNGIANLAPRKINFRMAGLITSGFAFVIGGLWTSFIANFGIGGFVNTLGATLAPIYGIMIVDYYVLRHQTLDVAGLYDEVGGPYRFGNGWNAPAVVAFAIAAVFSVATVWLPALVMLSGYAWVIGALIGGALYYILAKR
ncbi:NCS1 family nucleobase:cation symporter-1 [Sulfitobacter pseudonitzschiae]|uniref:NCS1 family nucleobase:cation symporter-1 n=1 Tax=Pseudosulfitobacter pseudonitzschiae TaxID=1402135 RepID=A0A9Q2NKB8_9RHOB|nr:NCS1 family nucleobase:cation symporter-1 [Pseudosulfitobacter pseudonitzschiae]MBM2291523.1 NCS1 family nucleobase:cation symporter-1 [Pseudosulfitobacter pseudonitzschiae]MBM2296441.1 NCS1 family nucleobase:cation symporter-1 [Pseudosulfitobacter pseudonitzschiae]MBM2301354.1 NCS1 family nucleobase:cation symporter-1 [Pseudosulfitobacter pseudonitzschiae]MBM2311138.1 NCS1 family nucleobase:cation symporter-1 [Pseudosulfitobacter pseudonitzschiae]MBM2316051.1 NCS1 family nucleobase:cation |tara:strand:- start:5547 stop:6959 length:1413 start_codon:yes stop_codon:yes gene_type:complete